LGGAPHILIVGAGYGGMHAVLRLGRLLRPGEATVTVVDPHSYMRVLPIPGLAAARGCPLTGQAGKHEARRQSAMPRPQGPVRIAGAPARRRPRQSGAQGARKAPGALRAANTVKRGTGHDQPGLSPATREIGTRRRELAPAIHQAFDAFSKQVFADGALPEKAKQQIAVAVAHVTQSAPNCIVGHTKLAHQAGATDEEIMETVWVAAEMWPGRCLRLFHGGVARSRRGPPVATTPAPGWPDTRSHSSCTPRLKAPFAACYPA